MARAVAIAAMAAGFGAIGAGLLPAQEIFWDGFEFGDFCAWSNPPTVYQEQEAFDEGGTNDSKNDAELIPTRCAIVEGTIGDPYNPPGQGELTYDTDYFKLSLEGPALVRFRIERFGAQSLFQPYSEVLYNSSEFGDVGYFPGALPVEDPVFLQREFYLPENGFVFLDPEDVDLGTKDIPASNEWVLYIDDFRNFGFDCPCGDEQNRYRFTVSIESIAGPTVPFSYSNETVSYPADGSLLRYRIPDGVSNLDLTETILDQLNPGLADVDTKLFLVRKIGSSIQTIKGNDDWEFSAGSPVHTDSKIGSTPLATGPYFLIVDHYDRYSVEAVDFGLTIQYLQTLWP